jgi:hypothetical protein
LGQVALQVSGDKRPISVALLIMQRVDTKPLASISFFTSTMLRAKTIGGVTMVCQ